MTDFLHIGPATSPCCDIHEWPTEGLARRLHAAMRERHGKGGVNSCLDCIDRAKASLPPRVKCPTCRCLKVPDEACICCSTSDGPDPEPYV